jgi:hypothetical protein
LFSFISKHLITCSWQWNKTKKSINKEKYGYKGREKETKFKNKQRMNESRVISCHSVPNNDWAEVTGAGDASHNCST